MRNLAIITARSGSKGVKNKNIRLLNGKPLLVYSIDAALKSKLFEIVMVSTDSEKYAEMSRKYGAEVPFLRSTENSGNMAGSWDAVKEVLNGYESIGQIFDSVCLLQPTSPMRTKEDIVKAYEQLKIKNADAITSVCECEYQVEYTMVLGESRSLREYRQSEPSLPRQMLPTYFRENGAIYIRKVQYMKSKVVLKYDKEYAYVMNKLNSIDIDTEEDFVYAEFLMNRLERNE